MDTNETEILAACRAGRLDQFTELYDRYFESIYRFVYYKTYHTPTAEDLTSLVFLKALENIGKFRAGSFSSWLYRIARNTVIDHYRTKKFESSVEDAWDIADPDRLDRDIENRDRLERIRRALAAFPSDQRDIAILRLWEDRSYREIADIVGKSEANCKVIYSRTIAKLRIDGLLALLVLNVIIHHTSLPRP